MCWHLQTEWRYSERMDMYHMYRMHWFIHVFHIVKQALQYYYIFAFYVYFLHHVLSILQVAIKIIPKSKVFSWSKVRKFACSLHE